MAGLIATTLLVSAVAVAQEATGGSPFGGDVAYRRVFDPNGPMAWLNPRVIVWILAQLHLLFAAFVLAVPMFVLIMEIISNVTKDPKQSQQYNEVAYEFCRLLTTAFSFTSIVGAIFTFALIGLYPQFFGYLAEVFGPSMYLYSCIFFGEAFCLYLYYYGWGKFDKWTHVGLGIGLNFFGISLMLIANAWTTFAMAPDGVNEMGAVIDREAAFFNFLLHPINIHRLIANLCLGGAIAAAYSAYKFLTTDDPVKKARYDWMGYTGNFIAILALLPLPFAGYYLGYEIYQFNQQLGIYMMGGVLSWLFVLQAVLIGALFFAANFYLWLGMDRIPGAERYRGWIKFLLALVTLCILVWATPKSLILSSAEIDSMGGTNHPILSLFGVMSAKNTAVNILILTTFLSFLLYRRGNKIPTVSWAKQGNAFLALLFGATAAVVIVIGVGGYIPSMWMESSARVAMSPYQVLAVLVCIGITMPVDIAMMRGAKEIGEIQWGKVPRLSQWTLFFLAVSFTWLMALMGFVRSALRQDWHVYEVLRDTSPEAYTPAIGYATMIVTLVVMLFFGLLAMVVWIAELGNKKKIPEAERKVVPATHQFAKLAGAAAAIALCWMGVNALRTPEPPIETPKELVEARAEAQDSLSKFNVVDPELGVYQVPVDQAMAMIAADPSMLHPKALPAADLDEMSPAERGEYLFSKALPCSTCHIIDGPSPQAPSLVGRWGKDSEMSTGDTVSFDEIYVKESLLDPSARLAKGFDPAINAGAPAMPTFAGKLNDQQMSDIIAYIQSL